MELNLDALEILPEEQPLTGDPCDWLTFCIGTCGCTNQTWME
jgi:hypothetical protein